MTREQIDAVLSPYITYKEAKEKAKDGFAEEMKEKQYGQMQTVDAWLWYYSGWCDALGLR